MNKINYKRIDNDGNEVTFRTLKEAANSINSKLENWKIQVYIAEAIVNNGVAFKYRWAKINK